MLWPEDTVALTTIDPIQTYTISTKQLNRIKRLIKYCLDNPYIGEINGPQWEQIWHRSLGMDGRPGRTQKINDVVDATVHMGWSCKCKCVSFDAVAQIVMARVEPKFIGPAQDTGDEILRQWNLKIATDQAEQGVITTRLAMLRKNGDEFGIDETDLPHFPIGSLNWMESDSGLKGFTSNGREVLRWYSNQKHLMQLFPGTTPSHRMTVKPPSNATPLPTL